MLEFKPFTSIRNLRTYLFAIYSFFCPVAISGVPVVCQTHSRFWRRCSQWGFKQSPAAEDITEVGFWVESPDPKGLTREGESLAYSRLSTCWLAFWFLGHCLPTVHPSPGNLWKLLFAALVFFFSFFSEKFVLGRRQKLLEPYIQKGERRYLLFLSYQTRHSTRKGVIKADSSEELTGSGWEESPLVTNAKRICAEPGS